MLLIGYAPSVYKYTSVFCRVVISSESCPIRPKRNIESLSTSSRSPSIKQSLASVRIAITSSFFETAINFENCRNVGSDMWPHRPLSRHPPRQNRHRVNLAQFLLLLNLLSLSLISNSYFIVSIFSSYRYLLKYIHLKCREELKTKFIT